MARRQKKHADIKIGRRLKELRLAVGLDRKDVSDAIGYKSDNTITCWEDGWRTIGIKGLRLLSVFFGVNLHWLQSGEGDKYNEKGGENSFAEQMASEQAMGQMMKITEQYTKAIEVKLAYLPRLIELLKEIEKITEVKGLEDIEKFRYDEFLNQILMLAMTVHRFAKKALTKPSDYKNNQLIRLSNLQKIESQSKEVLALLKAKGIVKKVQSDGLQEG